MQGAMSSVLEMRTYAMSDSIWPNHIPNSEMIQLERSFLHVSLAGRWSVGLVC